MPQVIDPKTNKPLVIPLPSAKPAPGKNLRVLHTQLDSWPKGAVLSPDDLPTGADIKRLISIGAVEEVGEPRTGEPPLGPDTIAQNIARCGAEANKLESANPTDVAKDATE